MFFGGYYLSTASISEEGSVIYGKRIFIIDLAGDALRNL
jgi:hypothetical protein